LLRLCLLYLAILLWKSEEIFSQNPPSDNQTFRRKVFRPVNGLVNNFFPVWCPYCDDCGFRCFGKTAVWNKSFLGKFVYGRFYGIDRAYGNQWVINSISVVVPFLVTSAVGISLASILLMPLRTNPYELVAAAESVSRNGLIGNWLWAAVLTFHTT